MSLETDAWVERTFTRHEEDDKATERALLLVKAGNRDAIRAAAEMMVKEGNAR